MLMAYTAFAYMMWAFCGAFWRLDDWKHGYRIGNPSAIAELTAFDSDTFFEGNEVERKSPFSPLDTPDVVKSDLKKKSNTNV